ncbi:MAG: serine/threonine-protein kinase [Pseudonocardiaceae bacterium]
MKSLEWENAPSLGRYRLLGQLGSGAMGRVFVGVSPDGRLAAVKQVHVWLAQDSQFRSRFRNEVQASRMVSGAYTAAVMDCDTEADIPWLASVFVHGPSLNEAVARCGPLPQASVRVLAAGLAAALGEIHRVGLVHRDLKPSNVLLTEDGPRMIDFGIARAIETSTQVTQAGSLIGTPGYMSPEQVDGAPPGPASDVFSLGAVLALAATGRALYQAELPAQVMYQIAHAEPDLSGVPGELRDLVASCLARLPDQRPTPDELLQVVGQIEPGESWLPEPVHQLIREQRDGLRDLLSGTTGSSVTATMLQSTARLGPTGTDHHSASYTPPTFVPQSFQPTCAAVPPPPAIPTPARRRASRAPVVVGVMVLLVLLVMSAVTMFAVTAGTRPAAAQPLSDPGITSSARPAPTEGDVTPTEGHVAPPWDDVAPTETTASATVETEQAAFDELTAQLALDDAEVRSWLAEFWVPQLASARPGLVVDGVPFDYTDILAEHRLLRSSYDARLIWSGEWSSFREDDFYVTVAAVPFGTPEEANAWCDLQGIDADHCFAKRLSTVSGTEGNTVHR